eukprot:TRINITY_DN4712_c0_g1_i1.p1 TRINITY_DN4712_c0_g1~~TRINITY_DN4712_c0_g1_i1.p1  ORF type:complete len:165 (+),score=54.76 TRINITY_DN4712_c0_g1_i1:192-686(+)
MGSLIIEPSFQHILRVVNTNIDGRQKIIYALAAIKGVGPRLATVLCKKAEIDTNKRAGEVSMAECDKIIDIMAHPKQFNIPEWFLNRRKDYVDGKSGQVHSNVLETKLREDIERLKKMKNHRGLRHYWGLRVRGQHTKTTGRKGRTVGVSKKKAAAGGAPPPAS